LSSVAIKNRIDHLLKEKIVKIQGSLDIGRFYGFTAHIHIEAEPKNILVLAEHLEKLQEVFQMVRLIGGAKLVACVLARNFEDVDTFIAKEIRSFPGVKNVEVEIGELPLLPKTIPPKF
jgi:DNA-binding Lrp family transcriptional regulator